MLNIAEIYGSNMSFNKFYWFRVLHSIDKVNKIYKYYFSYFILLCFKALKIKEKFVPNKTIF